jgi:multidrug efflux pump subunit AcrA (membrane-fusion protein)
VMADCKVGRALVRVLSFPAPNHEPILAVVREISPDTLLPLEGDDEFFEVTLELPPAETIPASMPLRAGMSVQVDILTEPKTVLSLLKKTSGNL